MRFKYQYKDIDCRDCAELSGGDCKRVICPYIMENLGDLRHDPTFTAAVADAENRRTSHKAALVLLKARGFPNDEPEPTKCTGCPYPRHGFICGSPDGSCLKTDMREIESRRRTPCPA